MSSSWKWYFTHYLAISSLLLIVYMSIINIFYFEDMGQYKPSVLEETVMLLMMPSIFILWFWMLTDYFKNTTLGRPVFWGWFMFLGSFIAAVIYFFVYWRPRWRNANLIG
jgi:hypothetical protein